MIKIKQVRQIIGMTQEKFGEIMGMSNTRVCQIENNAGGRKETFQHVVHLIAIVLIVKHGLLDEFKKKIRRLAK